MYLVFIGDYPHFQTNSESGYPCYYRLSKTTWIADNDCCKYDGFQAVIDIDGKNYVKAGDMYVRIPDHPKLCNGVMIYPEQWFVPFKNCK